MKSPSNARMLPLGRVASGTPIRHRRPCGTAVLLTLLLLLRLAAPVARAGARQEVDLSGPDWKLWQDTTASWSDDPLFMPPVDLDKLPTNAPTGGWEILRSAGRPAAVPGTAEEYLQTTPGPKGDITGVTWWCRDLPVPAAAGPRRVVLRFEACRQRAEIFVDHKLVGYDLIGNTPFEVDVTNAVTPGRVAQLAVRITDPGGNFDWHDKGTIPWGQNRLLLSHGFGGVTGRVRLIATDPVAIDDLYVQNTPQLTSINAEVTVRNTTASPVRRTVHVTVLDRTDPTKILAAQSAVDVLLPPGDTGLRVALSVPGAELWSPEHPNLYRCRAVLGNDGDAEERRFGFRWFEPAGIGSDAMFRLNGKRIVLRSAISWGFFPINGIYATPAMAEKQIRAAKGMGLNMLSFHRAIGQPIILEKADELGLLYYEEPGNFASGMSDDNSIPRTMAREKLLRMVRRDRSHPSLVLYNTANESGADGATLDRFIADMKLAHALDPSRAMTRTSGLRSTPGITVELANKVHLRPFDDTVYKSGWYDDHHAGGMAVWGQSGYVSPQRYLQRVTNKEEIVYWGEEGALSTPPRLGLIKQALAGTPHLGWDGQMYLDWYNYFDRFLTDKNMRPTFPTVDDLCVAMGDISMQHQGRRIQAIRINNDTDGYVINGWESEIIENHSGVVDCFRNPKGDPAIIARYNRPAYVAVMLRTQVLPAGGEAVVDFFTINEIAARGPHTLRVTADDASGKAVFDKQFAVTLTGGDVYGQLVAEEVRIRLPASAVGFIRVRARLARPDGTEVMDGEDSIFAVDWQSQALRGSGAVIDGPDHVGKFLRDRKSLRVADYVDGTGRLDWVVTAAPPDRAAALIVPAEVLRTPDGQSPGLSATFFNDIDFTKPAVHRVTETVDVNSPDGAPPEPGVDALQFYGVRWEGKLVPPTTGEYSFSLAATGTGSVTVNGQVVATAQAATKSTTAPAGSEVPIRLVAGQPVDLKIQWQQGAGDARFRLLWKPPGAASTPDVKKLLDRVRDDGTTLIVLTHAADWAKAIATIEPRIGYDGVFTVGKAWSGGVHFARPHPLFRDLPTGCGMDWPYQAVVRDGTSRTGLLLHGDELAAGAFHANMSETNPPDPMRLGTAVGVVRVGRGRVIFSTLDVASNLSAPDGPADVARKLLCNFIDYAATP